MGLDSKKLNKITRFDISSLQTAGLDAKEILESLGISVDQVSGDEIICHCPFAENHKNGDAVPSFSFNSNKLVYQCFTCGISGTLISLVKYINKWDDSHVEKWILEHSSYVSNDRSLKDEVNKRLINNTPAAISSFPSTILTSFEGYHPYLEERGVSKEIAKRMRIGYDTDHSGITIPHFHNTKLVGWQTRHLLQDENGKYVCSKCKIGRVPKYSNTHGFPKKNTLYNYSNALENSRIKGDKLIVVESPMTALKLMSFGYESVVATFGSWSTEQMFSLIGCLSGVILWPDSDDSGHKNVLRVIPLLTKFVPVQIAPVLEKEKGDPGDLTQEEVEDYLDYCYNPLLILRNKKLLNLREVKNNGI